jgi:DNA-binding winged helix-turn-helix (wHTH) protein/tetratricopeptide (TPR) repeat protein
MDIQSGALYEFGGFRLDTCQHLLSRGGAVIAVPPRTIDLLTVLVENHGRLVSKDELIKLVWPDTFIEETALAKGIHILRKVLGECAIETFPKRGYRLAVAVTRTESAVETASSQESDATRRAEKKTTRWLHPRWTVALATVVTIAIGSLGSWHSQNASQWVNSVAVLPFQSTLPDSSVAAGFGQELAARLGTLPKLRVVSPLFATDLRKMGNPPGVDSIVTGRLELSGGRLRASAQLVRASDGAVLWSDEGQDFDAGDLYTAQRILASGIASRLRDRVSPGHMAALMRRGSTNSEAYEAFLRGRAQLAGHPGEFDRKSASQARKLFERALDLDPGFSDAWAWLALSKQTQFFKGDANRAQLMVALDDAQRALSIDPDSIAARLALVNIYHSTGQAEEALRQAARCLQINPDDPEAALAAAKAYFRTGMLDRAADYYERYLVSYPDDESARFDLVHVAVFANDYERGLRAARPALAMQRLPFPTFLLYANAGDFAHAVPLVKQALAGSENFVHLYFGPLVLKAAGQDKAATRAWLDTSDRLSSLLGSADNERTHLWLAMTNAQLNRPAMARKHIRNALALNPDDPWVLFFVSETEALLGNHDAALVALRTSVNRGFLGLHYLDYYQRPLYGWNRYRKDPEFLAIRDGLARKIADLRARY